MVRAIAEEALGRGKKIDIYVREKVDTGEEDSPEDLRVMNLIRRWQSEGMNVEVDPLDQEKHPMQESDDEIPGVVRD